MSSLAGASFHAELPGIGELGPFHVQRDRFHSWRPNRKNAAAASHSALALAAAQSAAASPTAAAAGAGPTATAGPPPLPASTAVFAAG